MKITKKKFEKMYNSMTNAEMSKKLNISIGTLYNYLKKLGITEKGKGNRISKSIITFED